MSLDTDVTGFLLGVLESPTAVTGNGTLAGGGAVPLFDPILGAGLEDVVSTSTAASAATTAAMLGNLTGSVATTPGLMDPFMASTYDKLRCGHFTVVDKKLQFTIGK